MVSPANPNSPCGHREILLGYALLNGCDTHTGGGVQPDPEMHTALHDRTRLRSARHCTPSVRDTTHATTLDTHTHTHTHKYRQDACNHTRGSTALHTWLDLYVPHASSTPDTLSAAMWQSPHDICTIRTTFARYLARAAQGRVGPRCTQC